MTIDITSLSIKVSSEGIKQAAHDLEALSRAASSVESKSAAVKSALSGLSSSQANTTANIEKLLSKMQKQADLLGANTSQMNSYNLAAKNATEIERQMGAMIGAEVDAYKRLKSAQAEAIRMNNELNRAKSAGEKLNIEGQRAQDYRKLSLAQAEAIKMNKEYDASLRKLEQSAAKTAIREQEQAYKQLAKAQGEAIAMNKAYDSSIKANNLTEAKTKQDKFNNSMREAHALARGLSGSLGALWMTYGNLAGMAVGVGIGATLKSVVTIGADVEHILTGIQVRGEQTSSSMNKLRESLFDLSKGIYGPQEVAKAFNTLVMAGLNANQAVSSIGAALNLATAGGTTIEKSASTLVSVGSSIGYAAEGFSRIADVIAKTAALSMSSVETLSEAFKSASSVSKLYKVSLEDIATSLGVLSNLGIQGSAAGTALKNMYKELASEADKVQVTLQKMGMTPLSLKDKDGNFRSLLTMVKELDEGLKTLTPAEEKLAIARLTNERGMRLLVQALDVYRQKLGEGKNALQEFRDGVENSYAFAALASIQMSLTVKSQITSMMNTMKTVFAQTFKDIEPEVALFTSRMKAAFNSPEFKNGITLIAESFARLALLIAENIGLITKLIGVFIALKAAMMITSLLSAIATGFYAVTTAVAALRAGTFALSMVFPPLRLAIIATTAAMIAYNWAKGGDDAKRSAEVAAAYSKDIIEGMKKEAKQLEETTKLLKQKMNLQEASEQVERNSAYTKMVAQDQKALSEAREKASRSEFRNYAEHVKHKAEVARLERAAIKNVNEYNAAYAILIQRAKEQKAQLEANQKDAGKRPTSTNSLSGGPDKSEINDAYTTAMKVQHNEIKDAMRDLSRFEEEENLRYKAGKLSKLEVLENVEKKQIESYNRVQAALKRQMDISKGPDKERVSGAMEQATDDFKSKQNNIGVQKEIEHNNAVKLGVQLRIAELEKEHSYGLAAKLKWDEANSKSFADLKMNSDKFGGAYTDTYNRMLATQKAAIKEGFNREDVRKFNNEVEDVHNTLKAVQTATEGQGMGAMFEAATAASGVYADKIEGIRKQMAGLTDDKSIVEAQARLNNLAETQRKMWVGVGESISSSLENAFGKGGKAAGDLLKVAVNYNNLENKTAGARVKAYGDAAGAAKGFFKEGTKGYKVLEGAEKAFRLVELAGMAKSVYMTLTTENAKNAAKIPGVIMSFMSFLGPWGAAAAGVAIAAVLGGAFGGGGGSINPEERQKKQGTGSVLGDDSAHSESIVNSLSIMEKNSGLGLVQGNTMVTHLRAMADGLGNLAARIVQTSGITGEMAGEKWGGLARIEEKLWDAVGIGGKLKEWSLKLNNAIFGGKLTVKDTGFTMNKASLGDTLSNGVKASQYSDVEKDGGLFRSDKTSKQFATLGEDANLQFSKIIGSMYDTMLSAGGLLGLGGDAFTQRLKSFVVDVGSVSLKGLKGEEIQKALEGVFSKLGDDMAKFAVQGLEKFQRVGEGYLETLARVSNDLMQVRDVFTVMGQSLNATGVSAIQVSQDLISAAGGLETLTTNTKYFVDNFLTEAERMKPITESVQNRLAELGVGELTSIELYKKKVQSLNLLNSADQVLYAALIELAPAFKEAAEYAEEVANGTIKYSKAEEKARKNLQAAYDSESKALQDTIDKTKAYAATLKTFKDGLLLGASSPLTNMQKYEEARKQFEDVSRAAKGGDVAAQAKFTSAATTFLSASKIINASGSAYTSDFNNVLAMTNALSLAATQQVDVATASLEALNRQVSGLVEIKTAVMSVYEAIIQLGIAQGNASLGDTASSRAIDSLYQTMLGREADAAGRDFWKTQMANGVEISEIAKAIQQSGEYSNRNGSPPTPAQVAAISASPASTSQQATQPLVEAVKELKEQITELKVGASAQTGELVKAIHQSSDNNADKVVEGVGTSVSRGGSKNMKVNLV